MSTEKQSNVIINSGKNKKINGKWKSVKSIFPIKNIEKGIIETKDGRICKVLEIFPINFELKSDSEKEAILYQYKAFLKTCNFDMQILIQSKKNNLTEHIDKILLKSKERGSDSLNQLVKEYIKMINEQTLKTTIIRRFFIVFYVYKGKNSKELVTDELDEKTTKIIKTLGKCGNGIKDFKNDNFELVNNLYKQLNRKTAEIQNIEANWYEKY